MLARTRAAALVGFLGLALLLPATASAADGVVQRARISHVQWQELRPLVPRAGDNFSVQFQTHAQDLTSAALLVLSGPDVVAEIPAQPIGVRGPSDVWQASVPAPAGTTFSYALKLTDTADTAYLGAAGVVETISNLTPFTLDFQTLAHAPIGSTPVPGGTVFKVWSPSTTSAQVRGDFNNWQGTNAMTRVGEHYIAFVPNARAGQEYKYYFNNSKYNSDARARQLNESDNWNSVIIDPLAYQWRTDDFIPAPTDQWVVYQLHVGTFSGRNDPIGAAPSPARYRDVALRASHLAELGINAVMLNPIHEFPGTRSGGYNSVSVWAFERALGGPDDLKYMIDELHAHGIAVILDVVWNHFSSSSNFMWQYDGTQLYFDNPTVETPWGPQANIDRAGVADYFADSLDVLLGEYRFDGFRQDALYELVSASQASAGQRLIRRVSDHKNRRYPATHLMAEIYSNDPWVTRPTASNGLGLDGQYHERFKNAVIDATFAAASGTANISRLASSVNGSGAGVEGPAVLNYFELHDDAWPLNNNQRAVRDIDTTFPHDDDFATGRTKLANGLTILARGMPAILQGAEWLEDDGWETTKIDWSHMTAYPAIHRFYRDVIRLRTSIPSLFASTPATVLHSNDTADVLSFERAGPDGRAYLVVANYSNNDLASYRLGLPRPGPWGVIVSSDAAIYAGRNVGTQGPFNSEAIAYDGRAQSAALTLPARSILLLQHNPEFLLQNDGCSGNADASALVDFDDLTTVLANFGAASTPGVLPAPGDANGDWLVNFDDITNVLANFGTACN